METTVKKYRTHIVKSWHWYQRVTSSTNHTIEKYNESCEEDAKNLYPDDVMVLRDNIIKINGFYYYSNGFPMQNMADTDGYIDVRTKKMYPNINAIYADIN